MAGRSRIVEGVLRGARLRCPHCGEGRLFAGFLKVRAHCEVCGEDNSVFPSDDAPPYLSLLLVGHIVFPFVFWSDKVWAPALWLQFAIWMPIIVGITLGTLPFIKGAVIGIAWANGVTRDSVRQ
ncbi:DUF983 domain-containing protein [Roseomonas terrae]|jgi:uncharacterized protein (DUF983 family)|uniref:DUF983 domain-containing protein n=1 Tax=Neoroseomonas terrae TaxID=424799 RepID=A0ABS5EHG2_9PROT|nr:DUF983 domain-containing protein [Neoroseomonas terrae]MBR0650467.1 DUF983 domain-containing protein [Neoroseomonas terrae]